MGTYICNGLAKSQTLFLSRCKTYSYIRHLSRTPVIAANNLYEVLGLNAKASDAQIKAAYYKLSKRYHPDVNKSPEAIDAFGNISMAYEILGNWKARREYDAKFFGRRTPLKGREGEDDVTIDIPAHAEHTTGVDTRSRDAMTHLSSKGHFRPSSESNYYTFDAYHSRRYGDLLHYRTVSQREIYDRKTKLDQLSRDTKTGQGFVCLLIVGCFIVIIVLSYSVSVLSRYKKPTEQRKM